MPGVKIYFKKIETFFNNNAFSRTNTDIVPCKFIITIFYIKKILT